MLRTISEERGKWSEQLGELMMRCREREEGRLSQPPLHQTEHSQSCSWWCSDNHDLLYCWGTRLRQTLDLLVEVVVVCSSTWKTSTPVEQLDLAMVAVVVGVVVVVVVVVVC